MEDTLVLRAMVEDEVALPAQVVWDVIGDFGEVRRWADAVLEERLEQTFEGVVRVISLAPEGHQVRQLLREQEPLSYTYRLVGETTRAARSARNYVRSVSVSPLGPDRSRIRLESLFQAAEGFTDDEAVAAMTRHADGHLRVMKRALRGA